MQSWSAFLLFCTAGLLPSVSATPTPDFKGAFRDPPPKPFDGWNPTKKRVHLYHAMPLSVKCTTNGNKEYATVSTAANQFTYAMAGAMRVEDSNDLNLYQASFEHDPNIIQFEFKVQDNAKSRGWKDIQEISISKIILQGSDEIPIQGVTCSAAKTAADICTTKENTEMKC